MYGSRTNNEGVAFNADGASPILVGEQVEGNTIISLAMATDQNGQPVTNRATLSFKQSNGATFTHSFWDSQEEWAQVQVNREMLHICTKIVSEETYYALLEEHGDGSFQGFIAAVATHILPKAENMKFTLKIIYKENKSNGKWYPNFPKFPNFIAQDGQAEGKFTTNPKYDIYQMPSATSMTDSTTTGSTTAVEF